jgi:3-hydroxyacyl-[acyl-carrier-protein] dehydratase
MRFDLMDKVLERSAEHVLVLKNVSAAEEYLGDHFPGFPILPGVMMLETLVQAGRVLAKEAGIDRPMVLAEARKVTYAAMVRPGEALRVEVTLRKRDGDVLDLEGVGWVGDKEAVKGRLKLRPVADNRASTNG